MEKQAPRGSGGAGCGAGAGGDDCGDFLKFSVTATHIEHGSYQVADHVVQKAVAADAIDEKIASLGLLLLPR